MRIIAVLLIALSAFYIAAAAGTLSGSWQTTFLLAPGDVFGELETDLTIDWLNTPLEMSLDVSLSGNGPEDVSLLMACPLGDIDLEAEAGLSTNPPIAESLELLAQWEAWNTDWEVELSLSGYRLSPSVELTAGGKLPCGNWEVESNWGGCGCDFSDLTVGIDDLSFACVEDIGLELCVDDSGFDKAEIAFGGIPVPGFEVVLVAAKLCFELDEKSWSTSFSLSPDASESCIGMGLRLVAEEHLITGIQVTSVDWDIEVLNVKATYAHTALWDVVTLSGGEDHGLGTLTWAVRTYFGQETPGLFDVDSVCCEVLCPFGCAYSVALSMEYDMDGEAEAEVTLRGRW